MNRIFGFMLSLGLLSVTWNIVALLLHAFGFDIPAVDGGSYP